LTEGTNGAVSAEFAYDHNGNLTNDGEFVYEYDVENRLTRASRITDDDPLTTEVVGEYYYDAIGRRVRRVGSNSGTELDGDYTWLWNKEWQLVQVRQTNGGGSIVREHVDAGAGADLDDHVTTFASQSALRYAHTDHLYSQAAQTDALGELAGRVTVNPYGTALASDPSWNTIPGAPEVLEWFGHQGLLWDHEIKLFYNRNRIRSPELGRFGTRDPLGYINGPHAMHYALSNPLTHHDPSGLDVWVESGTNEQNGGHLKISVGDPNGVYRSFSFALDYDSWWSYLNPFADDGTVYEDYGWWFTLKQYRGVGPPGGALEFEHEQVPKTDPQAPTHKT